MAVDRSLRPRRTLALVRPDHNPPETPNLDLARISDALTLDYSAEFLRSLGFNPGSAELCVSVPKGDPKCER